MSLSYVIPTPTAPQQSPPTAPATTLPPGVWIEGKAVAAIAFGAGLVGAAVTYAVVSSKKKKRT
jgi:hypothetical protein